MIEELLLAGLLALDDYIATHVLTCLVPTFLLAGGIVTFIRREAILAHLGDQANKIKSFSLASTSSFVLAACSCTVIPVAAGLFYGGASIGVAFILRLIQKIYELDPLTCPKCQVSNSIILFPPECPYIACSIVDSKR
jgi:uncharacterized membrane protein YraQ (UPF0718 family)